ncbi:MAG: YqaE/Pmp3 family membrane protein [Chloroflexi bacterium]|nr:YqaE/Pmp3 family membrane protein [Chloroflexota bacterium]
MIFPPLAVIDRGCGTVLLVFLLTLPGVVAALVLNHQAVVARQNR